MRKLIRKPQILAIILVCFLLSVFAFGLHLFQPQEKLFLVPGPEGVHPMVWAITTGNGTFLIERLDYGDYLYERWSNVLQRRLEYIRWMTRGAEYYVPVFKYGKFLSGYDWGIFFWSTDITGHFGVRIKSPAEFPYNPNDYSTRLYRNLFQAMMGRPPITPTEETDALTFKRLIYEDEEIERWEYIAVKVVPVDIIIQLYWKDLEEGDFGRIYDEEIHVNDIEVWIRLNVEKWSMARPVDNQTEEMDLIGGGYRGAYPIWAWLCGFDPDVGESVYREGMHNWVDWWKLTLDAEKKESQSTAETPEELANAQSISPSYTGDRVGLFTAIYGPNWDKYISTEEVESLLATGGPDAIKEYFGDS